MLCKGCALLCAVVRCCAQLCAGFSMAISLYHPGSSDGLLALCLCLSVCFCVLAIMTQCSNAKSQPQWNVWLIV